MYKWGRDMYPQPEDQKSSKTDIASESSTVIAELYQANAPQLLAYLRRHLASSHDAEDLLFEVFLVALEHKRDLLLMLADEHRAWLWTVARNRMLNYHRRTRLHPLVPLEHLADMTDEHWTPEQVALHHEESALLQTHLQSLPHLQQEVLQLRFTGSLRCAEIASILNKNEGAIRTMLSRALNSLRSIYHKRSQEEKYEQF